MDKSLIRNFSIIAHIDHGKSTLSDRIIEMCGSLSAREMKEQVLDSMDLERERGITIKLNAVQLSYKADDGKTYVLHLIDTPGHVDFTYEVSRSLAACEGALLVVDASQGVEAQTLSNVYLALENDLEIMPVINKVDLPSADVEKTKKEIEDALGLDASQAPLISAKTGLNVRSVLEGLITNFPAPAGKAELPLQALIFDSFYDSYKGVICLVCIKNGVMRVGQRVTMMGTNATYLISEVGVRTPTLVNKQELTTGEVGWFAAAIKTIKDVGVGDTVTDANRPAAKPLPGYKKVLPMVFCGIYPVDNAKYRELQDAMAKIALSDAALSYQNETSQALGYGMRCGFLGLLHMDVIKERLEREYGLQLVATAPSVSYEVRLTDGTLLHVDNPSKMPDRDVIASVSEPYAQVSVSTPEEYVGPLMDLCQKRRGKQIDFIALGSSRRKIVYEMPLSEIMYSFFDKLKSLSRGYASMDYELIDYRESDLVKMDVLLNGESVDALSTIVYRPNASFRGKALVERLREVIPRHQFEIPVQAAIGSRVVARETIKAFRKNVLAKCYGGDVSRKKKLLEQQKEGKKRLKSVGSVSVPQEAFIAVLGDDE